MIAHQLQNWYTHANMSCIHVYLCKHILSVTHPGVPSGLWMVHTGAWWRLGYVIMWATTMKELSTKSCCVNETLTQNKNSLPQDGRNISYEGYTWTHCRDNLQNVFPLALTQSKDLKVKPMNSLLFSYNRLCVGDLASVEPASSPLCAVIYLNATIQ